MEFIKRALNYYDERRHKINNFISSCTSFSLFGASHDMSLSKLVLTKSTSEYEFTYEILSVFNNTNKIWTWAWAQPERYKNERKTSVKILNYGVDLDLFIDPKSNEIDVERNFIKNYLITSKFAITSQLQLDIFVAISAYLAKEYIVLPITHSDKRNKQGYYTIYHDISKINEYRITYFLIKSEEFNKNI